MVMNLYDLRSHHYVLSEMDCSAVFDNDGSVEFKDFIRQFERFQIFSDTLTNYYSYQIIKNGINKYANRRFWEQLRSN